MIEVSDWAAQRLLRAAGAILVTMFSRVIFCLAFWTLGQDHDQDCFLLKDFTDLCQKLPLLEGQQSLYLFAYNSALRVLHLSKPL